MAYYILIVDDEENIRWVFKKALEKRGLTVHFAESGEEAIEKIKNQDYLIVFSDIFMDGISGLDLLDEINKLITPPQVIVMTAQDTMNNTIEAMRRGALDYISKPFDFDEIYKLIEKAAKSRSIPAPEEDKEIDKTSGAIIGKSKNMQMVFKTIGKSATSDLSVLITGESGTGKEMVARALHRYSKRSKQSFICINCAAISRELLESELFGHEKGSFTGATELKKGKFELADEGTLFLDEIGDMEIQLQAKILRVLQNREFYRVGGRHPLQANVRIIAATNQRLDQLINQKLFREDLYHRLNVIHIDLPPLRERLEDVPLLADHFLKKFTPESKNDRQLYLAPETEKALRRYTWPGNIRELENLIRRGIVLAGSGPILPDHLPSSFLVKAPYSEFSSWEGKLEEALLDFFKTEPEEGELHDQLVQYLEKYLFRIVLDRHGGKQINAAKAMGINRNTLKRKLDSMEMKPKIKK
tara:strand:+ start:1250 stop:2665 length:1416 start_codon:yes stop_codon:yes gene_type:complete